MKVFLPALLLSALSWSLAGQSLIPVQSSDVIITVPANPTKYSRARKLNRKRFQFEVDSSNASLRMALTDRLLLRSVKMTTGPEPLQRFRRDTMGSFIRAEQQQAWQTLVEMGRTAKVNQASYEHAVNRFIDGKHSPGMASQWHTLAKMPLNAEAPSVTAKVRAGLFRRPVLTLDKLPGAEPTLLPAVDVDPCAPFDRFYERRKLRGYGIEKFRYKPYLRTQQKVIRKTFEVYFDKNRAQADLAEIRQFLRANDLTILHASMEGFSSVEGSAERNRELQEQRARRLMYALQSFNTLPVQSDTILFTDAWAPFREELRRSPYKHLDSLSNDSLRALINGDPELIASFEPYFRQHRKATLKLTLSGRLSSEEVAKRLIADFNHELSKVKAGDTPANREAEAKLLGMIDYYDKLYLAGKTDSLDIAHLVDNSAWPSEARILLFYHIVKQYEERTTSDFQLDSTFVRRGWNNIFAVAAANATNEIEGKGTQLAHLHAQKKKRLEQLVDVQYYTFKYIREGVLDPDVLCAITYPSHARYYGYKLNQLAMAYDLSKERHFSCYRFFYATPSPVVSLRADSASVDSLVNAMLDSRFAPSSGPGSRVPTYDAGEKGDYYFFVKMLAMGKEADIRQFVVTSDNYFEFDLLYLLRANVDNWDPFGNHFFDQDIGLTEMHSLVNRLKGISKHICPTDVNQLYLDYYMKSLLYFARHRAPGDTREMNLADESLRGITNYYISRPKMLFPKLVLHVTRQLHTFYWLPTRTPSIAHAFQVMAAADARRMLNYEEQEAWETYLKLYKPKYRSYRPRERKTPEPKSLVSKTSLAALVLQPAHSSGDRVAPDKSTRGTHSACYQSCVFVAEPVAEEGLQ